MLLVSPERLANPRFADTALPLLAKTGLLVVDEAHCISDWGFDFRPDYQRLTHLLAATAPGSPVLATTATANARVTVDVAAQLGADTLVLRGPLARASLRLSVVPGLDGVERFAWVADALAALPGSGIVYALTVDQAHSLAGFLAAQGHRVAAYTGQTEPDERARIEAALRANELKAVVATSALGMGYDKPDLGFCVHVGSPDSPVAYYQQVGRAGRALAEAVGVLLPAAESDPRIWDWFATATIPDPDAARRVLALLPTGPGAEPVSVPAIEAETGLRRGRLDALLKTLRVDGAVDRVGSGWVGTGQPWDVRRGQVRPGGRRPPGRGRPHAGLRGGRSAASCRCSPRRWTTRRPARAGAARSAPARCRRPAPDPTRTGCSPPVGTCAAGGTCWSRASSGRPAAAGAAGSSGWPRAGRSRSPTTRPGATSSPRSTGRTRRRRRSCAAPWSTCCPGGPGSGTSGRWRCCRCRAGPGRGGSAGWPSTWPRSAGCRCSTCWPRPGRGRRTRSRPGPGSPQLLAGLAVTGEVPGGPVLLVDDVARSTWTLTACASLLHDAGCGPVLPLVAHRRP